MNTYVSAYTRDYAQPKYKPKFRPSKVLNFICKCSTNEENDEQNGKPNTEPDFCIPYSFGPVNYCKRFNIDADKEPTNVDTKSKKCLEEQKIQECASPVQVVRTTYREHFCSTGELIDDNSTNLEKSGECTEDKFPTYTRLKKKPKLAIWELDEKTLKHMYRNAAKRVPTGEENQKHATWKSEYDDVYNRTGQNIIKAHKIRQQKRKKGKHIKL